MAHNSRFFDQATAWLRKIDSQTTICKMSLLYLTDVHHVLCRVRHLWPSAPRKAKNEDRRGLRCRRVRWPRCHASSYCGKQIQLTLLDEEGHPSLFAPIMIATLSTCAQLERNNISFRLQSGRKRYIEKGGKHGRKVGSVKTAEQMKAEYREVVSLLRKGYSVRDVAKLSG